MEEQQCRVDMNASAEPGGRPPLPPKASGRPPGGGASICRSTTTLLRQTSGNRRTSASGRVSLSGGGALSGGNTPCPGGNPDEERTGLAKDLHAIREVSAYHGEESMPPLALLFIDDCLLHW